MYYRWSNLGYSRLHRKAVASWVTKWLGNSFYCADMMVVLRICEIFSVSGALKKKATQ